ncbi:hypothetical protein SLE2022_320310 [Rubroshorea leprosula]
MGPSTAESTKKLWDTWNVRVLIIISLLVQSFLILFAPLRRQRGGIWVVKMSIWSAYLLADWLATFTIGLMLRAERSEILALWAPFLLLHLGGPDTITSFSLGDNDFWIRHLIGLMLQVNSTVYVFFQSLPENKLWLPTFLVLTAGIIKYAERTWAFYLASFDQFGNNWESPSGSLPVPILMPGSLFVPMLMPPIPPIPVQFVQGLKKPSIFGRSSELVRKDIISEAARRVGAIKNLLVGPPMSSMQKLSLHDATHQKDSHEMLRIIEIHLSLLYDLLHTKLPVVDSKIGYVCRTVNLGCILGALVSFPLLLKKHHHKLLKFDIWLTYVLLIGALALDLISILLLIFSDWIIIAHFRKEDSNEFINRRRWSNSIPQLNILACCFKSKDGDYSNKWIDFLGLNSFFENIRRLIQCVSSKDFVEEGAWNFIFSTVKEKYDAGNGVFHPGVLHGDTHDTNFAWSLDKFEYMESLLIWHIATEICYRIGGPDNSPSTSTSTSRSLGHRKICKLLSDYMFYLLVMEPTTVAASSNNLKMVFEGEKLDKTWRWPHVIRGEKGSKGTFDKDKDLDKLLADEQEDVRKLLNKMKTDVDKLRFEQKLQINEFSRLTAACYLAKELLNQPSGCPWELMGRFWVEIVCYAANNCQPVVHARQVSRGGQLLTLVWLLINYLGLTPPPKEWYDVLERKEPTDQNKELKEPDVLEQKEPADKEKELKEPVHKLVQKEPVDRKKELKKPGVLEQKEPADKKKEPKEPTPTDQKKELKEAAHELEQKEPADQKNKLKEPAHELEMTSATS